jgi:phosphoglycolate phosphatase-like HAD superfamily hydrolase
MAHDGRVDTVLVDFGNTLADETFMRRDCARFPEWTHHYLAVVDRVRDDWDRGRASSLDIAALVAERLGVATEHVHAYMYELCGSLTFFPAINTALRRRHARGGRQVLVTVNPDLFGAIAAKYALGGLFDAIVTSAEEHTDDKVELCRRGVARLGDHRLSRVLLIDNIEDHVARWVACGGRGYVFRDDAVFSRDVIAGRVPGFVAGDVADTTPAR